MATPIPQQIASLATNAQTTPTWLWKVFGGVLLMAGVWWLEYQLSQKSQELADAKTALAVSNLKAQQAAMQTLVEADEVKKKEALAAAADAANRVAAEKMALDQVEAEHKLNVAKVAAIKDQDWEALNKLAGVAPPTNTPPTAGIS